MKTIKITIEAGAAGLKIDKALLASGVTLSRKELRRILDKGGIFCNGKRVFVASKTVQRGDHITLTVHPDLATKDVELAPLTEKDILYWQDDIIAVNKAPGIPSVPTVSAKTPFVKKLLGPLLIAKGLNPDAVSACHRLDKETSGVLLLALTPEKAAWVMEQFKKRSVNKTYYALCYNLPRAKRWEVSCHLSPIHKKTGMVSVVRSGGHASSSAVQLIAASQKHNVCLVRVEPKTGRSHQIRVHLLQSQIPIIGDKRYALPLKKPLDPALAELSYRHHFLHAAALDFSPQSGKARIQIIKKSQMEFLVKDPLFF